MANTIISKLNHDAILSSEDYEAYQLTLEDQFVKRTQLAGGMTTLNGSWQYGIVDTVNPTVVTTASAVRPLGVKASATALALELSVGYAVSKNGTVLYSPAANPEIPLAVAPSSGQIYLLVIESVVSAGGTTLLTDYNVPEASQVLVGTAVNVYIYTTGWTPTDSQIVLAVVKIVDKLGGGLDMQIDLTQNTYSFNRPWYSAVDVQHRAKIGSGTVTNTNPHGTSINDLTLPGTVGLFQGLTGQGTVVSRDLVINKMIGARVCTEVIEFASIKTDTSGLVTSQSPYGKAGALYVELGLDSDTGTFPLRLGSVWDEQTPANAISAELLPGTNILVFGPNESITSDQTLMAQYSAAQFLAPPTAVTTNLLNFNGVGLDGESCTVGGFIYANIPDGNISLEGLGPFARYYKIYMNENATLTAYPQVIVPAQSVFTSIEPGLLTAPARLMVGLTNTTGAPNLSVQVTINGIALAEPQEAISAGTQTEVLTFSTATGFVDQVVPSTSYNLLGQLIATKYRYASVSSISVTSNNAGPNPQVQVWAEIEPGSTSGITDNAPLGQVSWNGAGVAKIEDIRKIQKLWTPQNSLTTAGVDIEFDTLRMLNFIQAGALLTNSSIKMFAEDFEDLKYFDSAKGFALPTNAIGVLGLNSSSSMVAGDTITINTSPVRILTAVSGTPVSPGQFSVGSIITPISLSQIRTNLITAINDPLFDSKVFAEPSVANPLNVLVTLQGTVGIAANAIVISTVVTNPGAMTVSGYNFAVDGYGECYMDREIVGLNSPVIPPNGNLNPYAYNYRRRYRSRAVALPDGIGAQTKFVIQIIGEDPYHPNSVRVRGSKISNNKVWEGWQLATVSPVGVKGLYTVTFSSSVHKIQVEYYGKARGIAAYMVRS